MSISPKSFPVIAACLGGLILGAAILMAQAPRPAAPGAAPTLAPTAPGKLPLSPPRQKPSKESEAQFREGLSAYNGGDYKKALVLWEPLADKENAAAQAGIGFMYHRGLGMETDHKKAFYWLSRAAEHNQPEGQLMLGSLYFYGQGVTKSYVQAFAWCDMAQDNGSADADACRNGALQSLRSKSDVKAAFALSQDLHHRFAPQR